MVRAVHKRTLRLAVFGVALFCIAAFLFSASGVNAQALVEAGNIGLDQVQETSGLGDRSFGTIVGQIIRVILTLLGVISIVIVIYGGFIWMTAGGSEEAVDKAKKTLANGAIGIAIVLSAFAITEFVMRSLGSATGTETGFVSSGGEDTGGNVGGSGGGGFSSGGSITSGGLQVKSIVPKGDQTYANLQVAITFTGPVDEASVTDNITIEDEDGEVKGSFNVKGDTVTFTPSGSCPTPNTSSKCFEEGVEYTVAVTGGKAGVLAATSKKALACSASSCSATFIAGDQVDLTAPEISNIDPINNEKIPVDQIVPIKALLKDDNAIAFGRVELNGQILETVTPAQGKDGLPDEFLMVSKKFSTKGDALKKEYSITIVAQDVAGNQAKLSYKVQVVPATCFDKMKDGDEMDIDCSPPGGECALCSNVACTSDLQCSNGMFCDVAKKICASSPVVKSVQPQDGAPETFVTITGTGFGTQIGEVVFLGDPKDDDDDVEADLACAGSWSEKMIVVAVPEGAVDGPLMVKNTAASKETTDDQDGLLLKEFQVNDVERPGLCSITPATGQAGKTKITITGNEFLTNASLERKLFIAGYLVDKPAWGEAGPNTVTAFTPALESGTVSVGVTIKSIASNPLEFTVQGLVGGASVVAAAINSVSPEKGGVGQYVTIKGADFGTTPNKVYFVVLDKTGKLTSDQTVADVSLPAQCAKSFWGDKQIVVKVPTLAAGEYAVVVQPFGKTKQSSYKKFVITTDKPGAQVCAIEPQSGPADGKVKVALYGDNFSAQPGGVIFGNKFVAAGGAQGSSWSKTAITVPVPVGVTTGEVRVAQAQAALAADACTKNPALCSNPVTYTVSDCRLQSGSCAVGTMCCGDGTCQKECTGAAVSKAIKGVFAWCFSTGDSCDVIKPPRVVEACSETDAKVIPSPAPSSIWSSTQKAGACNNAMITIKFSEPIDPETVAVYNGSESSLIVEECVSEDGSCDEVADQPVTLGGVLVSANVDGKNSGLFTVPKNLQPSTLYRVTLTNAITGTDTGLALLGPAAPLAANLCKPTGNGVYCFYFKTGDKDQCAVESVSVSPSSFTAETLGAIKNPLSKYNELQMWLPLPQPADKCQILDPESYDWSWAPTKTGDKDFGYAIAIDGTGTKTPLFAKQPTPLKSTAEISVTEVSSKKTGKATLSINVGAPVLTEACEINGPRSPSPSSQWGGEICYDAPIVVEFNQEVELKKADGTGAPFDIKILECTGTIAGKECDSLNTKVEFKTTSAHYVFDGIRHVYKFETNPVLAKNTNYLVEIPTTTKGLGEFGKLLVPKTGCRPGAAYCFAFKTSAEDDACAVKDVEVMPFDWQATEYGIQQTYNLVGDLAAQLWHAQAFGANQCVWLKNKYEWQWSIDKDHEGYAAIDPDETSGNGQDDTGGLLGALWDLSDDQIVAAYKETHDDDPVQIQAETEDVTGIGLLHINFPTPSIIKFEPSACGGSGVCSNAALRVAFSTAMKDETLDTHSFAVACPVNDTKDCFVDATVLKTAIQLVAQPADKSNKEFILTPTTGFLLNTKYRVVLTDGILSTANKKFTEFNYPTAKPTYFSWTFTVAKNQCLVDRVEVSPVAPIAKAQGDKQAFVAAAFSAVDACHPNGQSLDMKGIPWSWASSEVSVAKQIAATTAQTQTFVMVGAGTVINNEQSAAITAAAQSKVGTSTWKLQCNAPPVKCPVGTWAGADHCCHKPPSVSATYPESGDVGVCRNTLITIDATDFIKSDTVTDKNVRVGFAVDAAAFCTGGDFVDGYCYGKIPYTLTTVNTMDKTKTQHGRIVVNLQEVLPEDADIRLWVRPEGDDNFETVGLKSTLSVPIVGTAVDFSTSDGYCELTHVRVFPEETFFTKLTATQKFVSYGLSKQGNSLIPLSAIPGVYSWSWDWFTNNAKVAKLSKAVSGADTEVQPGGSNGQTTVTARATITDDTILKPSTKGAAIADAASVEAMLCEDPWIPETDPTLKKILDIHNTSFWYCRTGGKSILTKLAAVEDKLSDLSFTTLHSFRLVDPKSGGAIGFRFEKNLKQYSPREWYLNHEFTGTPEDIYVDGFKAIRVGNTVYIGFGNQYNKSTQFTNILIISLSEPATDELKQIFDQVIQNMQFVKNVNDVGLCYKNAQPTNVLCNSKLDCVGNAGQKERTFVQKFTAAGGDYLGLTCAPNKFGQYPEVKFNSLTGVATTSETKLHPFTGSASYDSTKAWHTLDALCTTDAALGSCEKNPQLSCIDNSNCPGSVCVNKAAVMSCNVEQSQFRRDMIRVVDAALLTRSVKKAQAVAQKYPIIATDSFIPGLSSSKWPSWNSFMQQLGITAVYDPLNQYSGCGADSDSETCWSVKNKKYQCTQNSFVYHYRTIKSGEDFALGIPFEQPASQQSAWQGDGWTEAKPKIVNDFCVGVPVVASAVCGDGAIGPGEQCDPPLGSVGGSDKNKCATYGDFTATCSATCVFEKISCVNKCGDGVVDAGVEECDEGSKYNGQYNHCGADCKLANSLGACGNGAVEKNEVCDIGTLQGRSFIFDSLKDVGKNIGIRCVANTQPQAILYDPVSHLITITNSTPAPALALICTSKEQVGLCDLQPQLSCIADYNCPGASACIKPVVGTKYSKNKQDSCNWNCKATGSYCGDGTVDSASGEECDGNEQGNACTKFCTASCLWQTKVLNAATNKVEPVCVANPNAPAAAFVGCGDGTVNPATGEECDVGKQNGVQCVAQYGSNNSCQYCTTTCKKGFVTGGFCGDGKKGGSEFCDGSDTLAFCPAGTDYATFKCNAQCSGKDTSIDGACNVCEIETFSNHTVAANGEFKYSAITLRDPTLGWLPITAASVNDKSILTSTIFVSAPLFNGNPPEHVITTIPFHLGVKGQEPAACFSEGKSYTVLTKFHQSQVPNLQNLKQKFATVAPSMSEAGGAFAYPELTTVVDAASKTVQFTNVEPLGDAGQYRVVVTGDSTPSVVLNMFVPSDMQGSKVYPTETGYILSTNKASAFGSPWDGCSANGWNISGASGTSEHAVKDAGGVTRAFLRWYDGCLTSGPFAQIESARAVNDVTKMSASRTVVVSLKQFNGTAYYGGVYEFMLDSFDNSTTVKIYYRDPSKNSTSQLYWRLAATLKPTDAGAVKKSDVWYPFFFMPEAQTFGGQVLGIKYEPENALWGGNYSPSANLLLKK